MMEIILSSFIFNGKIRLSLLMLRGGEILVCDNDLHCNTKKFFSLATKIISLHSLDLVRVF